MATVLKNYQPKQRYIPKIQKHEESLQLQVCRYLNYKYPDVIYRSDFASGMPMSIHQATMHKRMQSGRAWVDLFIYHPKKVDGKQYAGMALELKKEKTPIIIKIGKKKGQLTENKHIQEQYYLLEALRKLGYYAEFGVGYDDCINLIDTYMGCVEPDNTELF